MLVEQSFIEKIEEFIGVWRRFQRRYFKIIRRLVYKNPSLSPNFPSMKIILDEIYADNKVHKVRYLRVKKKIQKQKLKIKKKKKN